MKLQLFAGRYDYLAIGYNILISVLYTRYCDWERENNGCVTCV